MSKNKVALRREWTNKIEQWKLSGKNVRTWCRENQVVYTTFLGWRNRLDNNPKKINRLPSVKSQFIELKDQPKILPSISLECDGVIIHLKGEFDSSLLKKCVAVLRGASC
jgi:hypothetical protein